MAEGLIQDQVRLALSEFGIVAWRNNVGFDRERKVRYGLAVGSSDLVAIRAGRVFFVEIKTPIGRLSKEQKMFRDLVERHGCVYVVLRSADEARTWAQQVTP